MPPVKYHQFEIDCLEAFVRIVRAGNMGKGCRLTKEQCQSLVLSDIAQSAYAYLEQKKAGEIKIIRKEA